MTMYSQENFLKIADSRRHISYEVMQTSKSEVRSLSEMISAWLGKRIGEGSEKANDGRESGETRHREGIVSYAVTKKGREIREEAGSSNALDRPSYPAG
jgi:hypothetical protein